MKLRTTFCKVSIIFISVFFFVSGCAKHTEKETAAPKTQPQVTEVRVQQPADMFLKFSAGDLSAYKMIIQRDKSVEFGGDLLKDRSIKSGHTGTIAEMTFTQKIQSVDRQGNAKAQITIEALKYLAKAQNQVIIDFDSLRPKDQTNPINKLIGKSYEIILNPKSQVVNVADINQIEALFSGNTPSEQAAALLVSKNMITKRHGLPALIDADAKQYKIGEQWNGRKTFSFDLLGSETYEKIYELKEIKDENGSKVAFVEIIGVPGSKEEIETAGFSKMFDQTSSYNGSMKLNLTSGKVEEYSEKMQSEWLAVDPEFSAKSDAEKPSSIKMGAVELYSLEKID